MIDPLYEANAEAKLYLTIFHIVEGPLVTSGKGNGVTPGQKYELLGVASIGDGCADQRYPGIYM